MSFRKSRIKLVDSKRKERINSKKNWSINLTHEMRLNVGVWKPNVFPCCNQWEFHLTRRTNEGFTKQHWVFKFKDYFQKNFPGFCHWSEDRSIWSGVKKIYMWKKRTHTHIYKDKKRKVKKNEIIALRSKFSYFCTLSLVLIKPLVLAIRTFFGSRIGEHINFFLNNWTLQLCCLLSPTLMLSFSLNKMSIFFFYS